MTIDSDNSGALNQSDAASSGITGKFGQYRRVIFIALIVAYAVGLCVDLREPWYGVQDWNGAFFSQLARNHLRYPTTLHHGMPVVAVGADTPAEGEYSIYATHPPGLVWLVASFFDLFGESELVARLVPIVFSIIGFAGLLHLVDRGFGLARAGLFGAVYAFLPMSVYFGRMVDHEAICLASMVMIGLGYVGLSLADPRLSKKVTHWMLLVIGAFVGVWTDWVCALFVGLFSIYLLNELRFKKKLMRLNLLVISISCTAVISMIVFLVYAGLDGRWSDLFAIFLSRSGERQDVSGGRGAGLWWWHVFDNLTWPIVLLGVIGVFLSLTRLLNRDSKVEHGDAAARRMIWMISLTGVIWLAGFWQQFLRHEYWMFYLGPAVALLVTVPIRAMWRIAESHGLKLTRIAVVLLLPCLILNEIAGARDLFGRLRFIPQEIEDWKSIAAAMKPTDRVVLFENPIRIEKRGGYTFRNIVPPQIAYYLDRPFTVSADLAQLPSLSKDHAAFVIPSVIADSLRPDAKELLDHWKMKGLIGKLFVDLRVPAQNPSS